MLLHLHVLQVVPQQDRGALLHLPRDHGSGCACGGAAMRPQAAPAMCEARPARKW